MSDNIVSVKLESVEIADDEDSSITRYECPECGDPCNTPNGLRTHYGRKHPPKKLVFEGEPIGRQRVKTPPLKPKNLAATHSAPGLIPKNLVPPGDGEFASGFRYCLQMIEALKQQGKG